MSDLPRNEVKAERLNLLHHCGAGTDMGKLLRLFWQPVAVSDKLRVGTAKPVRFMGEELTLYRGDSGKPDFVGGQCPHRRTLLHTGWVQGERIRCMYHGWQFDGAGQCTQRPAEQDTRARTWVSPVTLSKSMAG